MFKWYNKLWASLGYSHSNWISNVDVINAMTGYAITHGGANVS
jgi:general stress protein CsbA